MIRSTTILSIRRDDRVAMAGDGQVTVGQQVMKNQASKIRRLYKDQVLVGFAGAAADAFALMERFEAKLKDSQGNLRKAAHELAREWRTDRVLRRLEALLAVSDRDNTFLISGTGDLIEPDDGIVAIGSGGAYALAAARALRKHTDLGAEAIAREAMLEAAAICVYTNTEIRVETL